MIRPIIVADWQVLRTLLRAGEPLPGYQLRLDMSRRTRDGSFLTDLAAMGLVAAVTTTALPAPRPEWMPSTPPAPFLTLYTLTPLGEYAAEHGEFEDRRPRKGAPS